MELSLRSASPVLDSTHFTDSAHLDLSTDNEQLRSYNVSSCQSLAEYIALKSKGTALLYGGYLERRDIYGRSGHFKNTTKNRDIHLGLDLWAPTGTAVYAALDATVHSFAENTGLGNYGPTIILKHNTEQGSFYTLYGHLNKASLSNIQVDQTIKTGTQIAELGSPAVNGDYPPHLHFQVIKDMGDYAGDYPGVCAAEDLAFYKGNCPNPMELLNLL